MKINKNKKKIAAVKFPVPTPSGGSSAFDHCFEIYWKPHKDKNDHKPVKRISNINFGIFSICFFGFENFNLRMQYRPSHNACEFLRKTFAQTNIHQQ